MKERSHSSKVDEDLALVLGGQGPCTYLLLGLLILVLAFPYLEEGIFARITLASLFFLVLLGSAFAIQRNRRVLILKMGLVIPGIALQLAALWNNEMIIPTISGIFYAVVLAITIGEVLNYILKRGPITADKLHGALAGYILIAFFWAFVYALTERASPGSFGPSRIDVGRPGAFFELMYFSLTTLTTSGFGDIYPLTNQARSFVMIEEFVGVFFVGVLIARLAGLYPPASRQ